MKIFNILATALLLNQFVFANHIGYNIPDSLTEKGIGIDYEGGKPEEYNPKTKRRDIAEEKGYLFNLLTRILNSLSFNESNSVIYHNSWETNLSNVENTTKPMFIIATACHARVILRNTHTEGDIIINADGGGCYAFVLLENVSAKNILILAEANGPVEINYLGNITAQGSIIEDVGFYRDSLKSENAVVTQGEDLNSDLADDDDTQKSYTSFAQQIITDNYY